MKSVIAELESLLFDWDIGTLDAAGIQRIRELLRESEEARVFLVRHQTLNAALRLDVDAGLDSLVIEPPGSDGSTATDLPDVASGVRHMVDRAMRNHDDSQHVFRVSYWAAAAAGFLTCVLAGRLLHLEFSTYQSEVAEVAAGFSGSEKVDLSEDGDLPFARNEPISEGVALVTRLVDVAWAENQDPLEVGDALLPGRLAIDAGYAQIEFFCGATVVVEGPAELDLRSPLLAYVRSGRLRANVPPAARGFSLEVDEMKVVDLGTEFGLSVSEKGTNVQVFDGEVELHQSASEKRTLTEGMALVRNANGDYLETEVTPDRFLDIQALDSRADDQQMERHGRWQDWSRQFRRDERLLAYFAFDSPSDWLRRLESSIQPADTLLDGAIVGAHQVTGRWNSKGGLEFKRPGDRVRVQIPGEFQSLTFACWVKIDSLDRWYNSLFLTDGYEKGEPHWQILNTGQIYFSVRPVSRSAPGKGPDAKDPQQKKDFKALSPPIWEPTMSGKWTHLAVTCDLETNTIVHYLNGEELSRHFVPAERLPEATRIGTATIGNWSIPTRPDAEFAIRNLNGSMDEFAILAAALSAEEIYEMYENGKPQ